MKKQENRYRMGFELTLGALLVGSLGAAQTLGEGHAIHDPYQGNLGDDVVSEPQPEFSGTIIDDRPFGASKGGFQGNLEDDMHPGLGGVVFDGGEIFVDLVEQPGLTLGVQVEPIDGRPFGITKPRSGPRHVVLAGGQPGNAGVVVISNDPPRGKSAHALAGQAIYGSFGMDGSFVVELPEDADVYVQGWEVTGLGHQGTGVLHVGDASSAVGTSWDSSPLSSDVYQAIRNLDDGQRSRIRFYGSAQLGNQNGFVEFTAEIGPRQDGYVLVLEGALAQGAGLSVGSSDGALHLANAEDLMQALEGAVLQNAFSELENQLAAAQGHLAAQRARMARQVASASGGDQDSGATVGSADPISGKPHGIRPPGRPQSAGFDGPVLDGGTITLPGEEPAEVAPTLGDVDPIAEQPTGVRPSDVSQSLGGDVHVYDGGLNDGGEIVIGAQEEPTPAATFGDVQLLPGQPSSTSPGGSQGADLGGLSAFDGDLLVGGSIVLDNNSAAADAGWEVDPIAGKPQGVQPPSRPQAGAYAGSIGDAGSLVLEPALDSRFQHALATMQDLMAASQVIMSLQARMQSSF